MFIYIPTHVCICMSIYINPSCCTQGNRAPYYCDAKMVMPRYIYMGGVCWWVDVTLTLRANTYSVSSFQTGQPCALLLRRQDGDGRRPYI